jgi:hypothetical protein
LGPIWVNLPHVTANCGSTRAVVSLTGKGIGTTDSGHIAKPIFSKKKLITSYFYLCIENKIKLKYLLGKVILLFTSIVTILGVVLKVDKFFSCKTADINNNTIKATAKSLRIVRNHQGSFFGLSVSIASRTNIFLLLKGRYGNKMRRKEKEIMKNVCLLFYLIYARLAPKIVSKERKETLFDPEKWTTQGMHYKKKKKTEDKIMKTEGIYFIFLHR